MAKAPPEVLAIAGKFLFGRNWVGEMARALDVSDRSMRRFVAGTAPVPDGVIIDLRSMLVARRRDIDSFLASDLGVDGQSAA